VKRRAATMGLAISALTALAACGGGDDGGGSTSPPLAEPQATEAVAAAVLSAASVVVELAADPPAAEDVGNGTAGVAIALASCPGGGSLSGTCVLRHSGSTVRSVLRHCQLVDEATGLHVTVDGRLTVKTPNNVCDFGRIPVNAVRTYRFDDFSAVVSDGEGVVETFAAERLVETIVPLETGCERDDATLDLDGALALERRGGVHVELRAADLHLERRATGSAGRCGRRIEASGRLTIDDHSALRHSEVDLDGLAVEVDADGGMRRVDGGFALDCVPAFTFTTDEPLAPGNVCPAAGALVLERADGSSGTIDFADGGVRIDADADGTPERVAADCRAPALAQCPL
jgi:hypothetical protein